MTVLILTEDIDATADAMVRVLADRGVGVDRVNTAWFPTQMHVSARLRGGRWTGSITTPGRTIDLEAVTAVWYRAPRAYEFPADLTAPERAHANLEAKYGLGGVLGSLPALWVNHPARLADAGYKPVQLVLAHDSGLRVPDSVITNEPGTVRRFAEVDRTVTKMLGSNSLTEEGVHKLSFTRIVGDSDPADLWDLRGVETTTHLFQRWVPKHHEVRMTVIGRHMTAAAITAHSTDATIDFRADYDSLTYELVEPPDSVAAGVRRLMARMGLVYGALDFVVTPDGDWVFLEINAGGQYGFIEDATGAPLTEQLADLLAKGQP
ncbi:MAG: ATP-grasp ribosomal peptide maturase [Pseudonocardia sp.]